MCKQPLFKTGLPYWFWTNSWLNLLLGPHLPPPRLFYSWRVRCRPRSKSPHDCWILPSSSDQEMSANEALTLSVSGALTAWINGRHLGIREDRTFIKWLGCMKARYAMASLQQCLSPFVNKLGHSILLKITPCYPSYLIKSLFQVNGMDLK